MFRKITDNDDGYVFEVKGSVAANSVAFYDASNGEVSATPTTNGGIVGISKGNASGVTTVTAITAESLVEVDAADIASVATVAADITAKKVVFVYLDTDNDTLTVVADPDGAGPLEARLPVGRIVRKAGNAYVIKFNGTALV